MVTLLNLSGSTAISTPLVHSLVNSGVVVTTIPVVYIWIELDRYCPIYDAFLLIGCLHAGVSDLVMLPDFVFVHSIIKLFFEMGNALSTSLHFLMKNAPLKLVHN